jgi:hypothetical protein
MAIFPNPHKPSNWDSRMTIQLGYKHIFYQNVVSTEQIACVYNFVKT